ncbi:MAG: hypothetical protein OQL19_21590 [Gammaproteobacteria bacterium]|nr:hypothetical protein [Gammaproteobacteria bacterium]
MQNSQMEFLSQIHKAVTEMDNELSHDQQTSRKIKRKTLVFIKLVLAMFIAFIFFLIFEGFMLSKNIQLLAGDMVLMYKQFGEMSHEMHQMTANVNKMEINVRTIPVMTSEMGLMVSSVQQMHQNVSQMTSDVVIMQNNLNNITGGMNVMTDRFSRLNQTVHLIEYNVHQMSKTVP